MTVHRKSLLINSRFQLRFAFYVCSWLVTLSLAYPLVISSLFDYLFRYLALDPLGPTLASLEKTREELLWLLIFMQGILLIIAFLISIFMSHKIAGPLLKLRQYFKAAKGGNIEQPLSFRKKDYFQELVSDYNDMMKAISKRMDRKTNGIQQAIPKIEKVLATSSSEIQRELEIALKFLRDAEKN